jgi:hypothetical protein
LKNQVPTVNKAVRKKGKLSIVAAGTNIKEPNAESNKPADNVFCIQFL